jgi:hypothetical protein
MIAALFKVDAFPSQRKSCCTLVKLQSFLRSWCLPWRIRRISGCLRYAIHRPSLTIRCIYQIKLSMNEMTSHVAIKPAVVAAFQLLLQLRAASLIQTTTSATQCTHLPIKLILASNSYAAVSIQARIAIHAGSAVRRVLNSVSYV